MKRMHIDNRKTHDEKKNPHARAGWMLDKKAGRPKQVWVEPSFLVKGHWGKEQ
jgi:hypothetical protein